MGTGNGYRHRYSQLQNGPNYFRLKFTSSTGHFNYSNIIKFTRSCGGGLSEATIAPNPVINQFKLHLNSEDTGTVNIEIYNPVGSLVSKQNATVNAGPAVINFNATTLVPDMYLLRVTIPRGKTKILKLVKK